jgi:hypothetical protein
MLTRLEFRDDGPLQRITSRKLRLLLLSSMAALGTACATGDHTTDPYAKEFVNHCFMTRTEAMFLSRECWKDAWGERTFHVETSGFSTTTSLARRNDRSSSNNLEARRTSARRTSGIMMATEAI